MSYQVLARKYRPKNFDTLVGQEHVVRALSHALQTGRLHHAYLFTGTRGVGKTTLSRILAKSLNCIGPDGSGGITATPCGVCDACVAIDAGRFVDYIEMDAASNRGVDEMAQLLEQAVYAPSNARFKVYMIDEVHMLTNHAFNSMLKTLEEPPEHVKFILATTDPQKIPVTVLSRCLQFNLKQMPPGHIVSHLDNILGQEGISFEQPALRLLAQGAHGSMRDALSLTDQAIAYAAGQVTLEAVQGMLGALDQSYLVRLLDALLAQNGADLIAVADEMASRSLSYNGALQDLGTLLHRIALAQSVPGAVPEDLPELADIMRLAGAFDPQEAQLYYQIAVHGRNEIGLAPDEYAGFTMTLLRMLAFRPGNGGADAAPPSAAGARPAGSPARAAAAAAAAQPTRAASAAMASHATMPVPGPVLMAAAAAAAAAAPVHSPAPTPAPVQMQAPAPGPESRGQTHGSVPGSSPAPTQAPAPAHVQAPAHVPASSHTPAPATPGTSPARAAINAALEAARAASRGQNVAPKRPTAMSNQAAAATPPAAPEPEPEPAASPAPALVQPRAPAHVSAPAPARAASSAPPPWEHDASAAPPAQASAPQDSAPQYASAQQTYDDLPDDEPPSWVTEFSDDSAVSYGAPAGMPEPMSAQSPAPSRASAPSQAPSSAHAPSPVAAPVAAAAPVRAPAGPKPPYVITPVPAIGWDGNWPALAAGLPLRGVSQQLAFQTELVECSFDGHLATFRLRVPIDTLRASGNTEKLTAALQEHFAAIKVTVDIDIGAVWYTASAEQRAYREQCQREAEQTVADHPFVQELVRHFDAFVVPGSIRPANSAAA
jgi:DNA polymerase-3 subunit gamma/tau